MSGIVKKMLYIVLIIAFTASFISTNATLIPETELYIFSLFGAEFEITTELFDTVNLISSTLTFSALLVIINVINMSNKNTEITQGTLDAKQNMALSNQAWIMEGLQFMVKTNNIGDIETKTKLDEAYTKRIPLTIKLSNTSIDFKTVDLETKIFNINNTIEGLNLSIAEAKLINDSNTIKILTKALVIATSTLAVYTKNINV
jgi:hypothetical protein